MISNIRSVSYIYTTKHFKVIVYGLHCTNSSHMNLIRLSLVANIFMMLMSSALEVIMNILLANEKLLQIYLCIIEIALCSEQTVQSKALLKCS